MDELWHLEVYPGYKINDATQTIQTITQTPLKSIFKKWPP